eukprot:c29033_g1_i1 orf=594-2204(-)
MGRPGGAVSNKKDAVSTPEELESKRLRDLAFSRGLISRFKAHPACPLQPSNALLKCDGKDIVKKGHRKNKYLFAFPGLAAPVAGGKFGELTQLNSKNPVLYVDFPQGRLKLLGTIVYPKNKYLTLQFRPGSGNIVCEDCFESLVVFSEYRWIGTKEENPKELRLDWPKELLKDKLSDIDFTAGASRAGNATKAVPLPSSNTEKDGLLSSPEVQFKLNRLQVPDNSFESNDAIQDMEEATKNLPVRQSARTSGKKFKYADSSSEDEGEDGYESNSSDSQQDLKFNVKNELPKKLQITPQRSSGAQKRKPELGTHVMLDDDGDSPKEMKQPCTVTSLAQMGSTSRMEAVTSKASENVATASTALKQSILSPFLKSSVKQEDMEMDKQSAPPTSKKTPSADVSHGSFKPSASKRQRKSYSQSEMEDIDLASSEDVSEIGMVTPSKMQKQSKNVKDISDAKGSGVKLKSAGSKRKVSQDGKIRKQSDGKSNKQKPAPAMKGRTSARQKNAKAKADVGVELDEDLSDPEEISDDSDEDWVG